MNAFDATRIACYVVISTAMVVRALARYREASLVGSVMYASYAAFFSWLVMEATLTSSGVNTRELRAIATPITVAMAFFSIATLFDFNREGILNMGINRLPGAIWPIVYTAIYLGLQTFVSAQWPEAPPAAVLGAMVTLGGLQGLLKVMWPAPPAPELPPGVSAQAGMAGPAPEKKPGKANRFFI